MNIVTVSGSLRAVSINSALLRLVARLAPAGVSVAAADIGILPLFNPDLALNPPEVVVQFLAQIAAADALIIASPEYAHGVTGVIKNALDWLVSLEAFAGKPVAVLNAAPRASHADAALCETLATMSAALVNGRSFSVPLVGSPEQVRELLGSEQIVGILSDVMAAITTAIRHRK